MRIHITSVLVDDQEKALRFYPDILGSVKKTEVPVGAARWLTVVSSIRTTAPVERETMVVVACDLRLPHRSSREGTGLELRGYNVGGYVVGALRHHERRTWGRAWHWVR